VHVGLKATGKDNSCRMANIHGLVYVYAEAFTEMGRGCPSDKA